MCDTLVVVQPGRVWFAKNSDREADEPQVLEWHARQDGLRGELACTWRLIPQVTRTHAVVLSRPIQMWGAEMGFNEHGVVIGNEAVFTKEPVPKDGGLTGMDLLRLALERAESAEEAVEVIKALHAEFGQGGSCGYEDRGFRYFSTFLIADARGAFVLETAGRETAVERVSSGARSISNGLTIPGFAEAHSDVVKTGVSACRLRRARTQALGAQVGSARELAGVLRDHGATRWPSYEWHRGAMRAPCMHAGGLLAASQTTASLLVELTPERMRAWATATSAPCLAVFKPVTLAPLDVGPTPGREPDDSLWWAHERLHRAVMKDPARLATFLAERDALEARCFADEVDAQALWHEARAALAKWTEQARATPSRDVRPWAARRYWRHRRRA
ncbi:MAG: carcinine hydrolase/isopenicillin-N N-acyltransferase family protein [Myxococcota bacterium]